MLSAHRGLPSAALFTDLDLLRAGDHFYIYVLDRVLAYEVDQVLEVDPDHTEDLDVLPGEDLVTLVTCTPYGVNTRRLLVRGHRVAYTEDVEQHESQNVVSSVHTQYTLWVILGLSITLVFILLMLWLSRRKPRGGKRLMKGKPAKNHRYQPQRLRGKESRQDEA